MFVRGRQYAARQAGIIVFILLKAPKIDPLQNCNITSKPSTEVCLD